MQEKIWDIKNIATNRIPFHTFFQERNLYQMSEEVFFYPKTEDENNPMELLNMDKAIQRIQRAIENREKIYIYGDYDVDGTSSIAILLKAFVWSGYDNIQYYVPSRHEEGYGLNIGAMDEIYRQEGRLIITVDCGITSVQEVDHANRLGMDVIVTDHHQCPEILPEAYCIINPHQKNCTYPFKNLCGAGIAYKLAEQLLKTYGKKDTGELVELAGIATVADIMEINGENRILVKSAIESIKKEKNVGICALIKEAGIDKDSFTADSIGFGIGPRINSAGRIAHASLAVKLYMASSRQDAEIYAKKLNALNKKRQEMVNQAYEEALLQVDKQEENQILVVYKEGWNSGIIGIVAGRLLEKTGKPSIVIALKEEVGTASCRSIEAFPVLAALKKMENHLIRFGGHTLAAGFSIEKQNIEGFVGAINEYAREILNPKDLIPRLNIEYVISLEDVEEEIYDKIQKYEPFGISNEKPLFAITDIELEKVQFIGKDQLHFKAIESKYKKELLKFYAKEELKDLKKDKKVDVAFYMNKNVYMNKASIQMFLEDIRYSYNYEKEYAKIAGEIHKMIEYLERGYEFKTYPSLNMGKIAPRDLPYLVGKTAFLCYTYTSYFYLRKIMQHSFTEMSIYPQEGGENTATVIFCPLLQEVDISIYDNIVVCDALSLQEKVRDREKKMNYYLDFDKYSFEKKNLNIRENMVKLYNFYRKNALEKIEMAKIIHQNKMDTIFFFLSNAMFEKCKLVDINYDFQYNVVYVKINKVEEKKDLRKEKAYLELNRYFLNVQ